MKQKLLAVLCLMKEAGILFILMNGNLNFGFKKSVANKSIGKTPEDEPEISAVLFGFNKMQAFIIP